jgi:Tfp pilus assembly protein FimV
MVTISEWFIRYGFPAGFLLLATVVVLLARNAIHDGDTGRVVPRAAAVSPAPPKRAHVRSTRASAYSVRSGDTLATIAERFATTVDKLVALNPGVDPQALRVGQIIRVD